MVEAIFTADNIAVALQNDLISASNFAFNQTVWPGSVEGSHNLYFRPNDVDSPKAVFDVTRMIAKNTGQKVIDFTKQINQVTIEGCNSGDFVYDIIKTVATKDEEGTVYILLINKDLVEDQTLEINFESGEYDATISTVTGTDVNDRNQVTYDNISITQYYNSLFGEEHDNSFNSIKLSNLSVTVLKLTPINSTCNNYTFSSGSADLANYPGPYGEVKVKNGATLTINGEARFCTEGVLDITDGGHVILNGTLTADEIYWKGVNMTGSNQASSFTASSSAVVEKATTGLASNVGVINCTNTTFQNNKKGVALWHFNVVATFTDCTFRNTTAFNYPGSEFHGFANLLFMDDGPDFLGCSFVEERTQGLSSVDAGIGIAAINANFTVDKSNAQDGVFQNLIYGVHNTVWGIFSTNEEFKVHHAKFNGCRVGVQALFATDVNIRENEFNLTDPYRVNGGDWAAQRQYGVVFSGSALNFDIEHNTFNRQCDSWSNCNKEGTHMYVLGEADNVIRRNIYNNVSYANIASGPNGDPLSGNGLLYECNKMNSNDIDFLTDLNTVIKHDQGVLTLLGTQPADNIFQANLYNGDFLHGGGTPQPTIDYYYHASQPDNVSNVILIETSLTNACLESPEVRRKLTKEEKQALEEDYKKLALNLDKAKDAFHKVEDKKGKEKVRRKLEHAYHQKWSTVKQGLLVAKSEGNRSEARTWLSRFGTYNGDILLAQDYASRQEWGSAIKVLGRLSQNYELTNAQYVEVELISDMLELVSKEGLAKLDTDAQKELDDIARQENGLASVMAQGIMAFYGKYYAPNYVEIPTKLGDTKKSVDIEKGPRMAISPNPADYNVNFDWSKFLVLDGQKVSIELSNKTGGLVTTLHPRNGVQRMEWTTERVSSGMLYYRLLIDGKEVDSGQILISK